MKLSEMDEDERLEYLRRRQEEEEERRKTVEERMRRDEEGAMRAEEEARLQAELFARYITDVSHKFRKVEEIIIYSNKLYIRVSLSGLIIKLLIKSKKSIMVKGKIYLDVSSTCGLHFCDVCCFSLYDRQRAALEQQLKFHRGLFVEAGGLEQTQDISRPWVFSYFALLKLLGLADPTSAHEDALTDLL